MGGGRFKSKQLNDMLLLIVNLLNKYEIENWFIGYGTLLGIVRNDSCIDDDDDLDILIDIKQRPKIQALVAENNFSYCMTRSAFCKINVADNCPTIDFYFADVDTEGNFIDKYEKVTWSKVYPLTLKDWEGIKLPIPANPEIKLATRYGADWRTPRNYKGDGIKNKIL